MNFEDKMSIRQENQTFEYYGYVYPDDGPHARLMAVYMGPPDNKYSEAKWRLYRDWAKKRRICKDDMQALSDGQLLGELGCLESLKAWMRDEGITMEDTTNA